MITRLIKLFIISTLLFCISCGKESTQTHSQVVEKGSGRLVLDNSIEVLSYRQQFEKADINERIELSESAPVESYLLVIEDIEKGDFLNVEKIDVTSWLTNDQKEIVRNNDGCTVIKFYDSKYTPETNEGESVFILGDISFQDSSC